MSSLSKRRMAFMASVALFALAGAAQASVVAGPNAGGLGTFTDTDSGLNWARLDNFFGNTPDEMVAAVEAAGFTVADRGQVEALLAHLPLNFDNSAWDSYAPIIGSAPNRQLFWGVYGPQTSNGRFGYAYAYRGDSAWNVIDDVTPHDFVENAGSDAADENIFAFRTGFGGGGVPEPAAWALMITGFGAAGGALRRRRAAAAA